MPFCLGELRRDRALKLYGAFLALCPGLSMFYYLEGRQAHLITQNVPAACWPFWQNCEPYRFLNDATACRALWGVVAISITAAGVLVWDYFRTPVSTPISTPERSRATLAGWALLIIAELAKLSLIALDVRLRHNQTWLELYAVVAFCFFGNRRLNCRLLVLGFYFAAAFLKLDHDWLSGAVLGDRFWFFPGLVPRSWLPAACVYVVILELILIWGLFARSKWIFWGTVSQLVTFHLLSWSVVGFYYPILMGFLLSLFVLDRVVREPMPDAEKEPSRVGFIWLGFFAVMQIWPKFLPGEPGIHGQGRTLGLYMFLPMTVCDSRIDITVPGQPARTEHTFVGEGNYRDMCDPLIHRSLALNFCRQRGRVDWTMTARRETDSTVQEIIHIPDLCGHVPDYHFFSNNEWIRSTSH